MCLPPHCAMPCSQHGGGGGKAQHGVAACRDGGMAFQRRLWQDYARVCIWDMSQQDLTNRALLVRRSHSCIPGYQTCRHIGSECAKSRLRARCGGVTGVFDQPVMVAHEPLMLAECGPAARSESASVAVSRGVSHARSVVQMQEQLLTPGGNPHLCICTGRATRWR